MADKGNDGLQARILIVEDEGIIAFCLESTLTDLGYDVVGAVPSGEEALEEVRDQQPDLVLMDIQLLGKMNGIEAATQIRAQFGTPVVYMTGYAEGTLLEQLEATGTFYLDKLARDEELDAMLKLVLRRRKRGAVAAPQRGELARDECRG